MSEVTTTITFPEHFIDYSLRELEVMRRNGDNPHNFHLAIVTRLSIGLWHYCVLADEFDAFEIWVKRIHGDDAYVAFL